MFTTYRTVVESPAGYLTTFNKNQIVVVSLYTEIRNWRIDKKLFN